MDGSVRVFDLFSQGGTAVSMISILAGVWLVLSLFTAATLASIAARGHERRDDKKRRVAGAY